MSVEIKGQYIVLFEPLKSHSHCCVVGVGNNSFRPSEVFKRVRECVDGILINLDCHMMNIEFKGKKISRNYYCEMLYQDEILVFSLYFQILETQSLPTCIN